MVDVSYLVAFAAGIVSFLAPCVLPLVPGYLAYLAGTTVREGASQRWDIFIASLLFVAGFSFVFAHSVVTVKDEQLYTLVDGKDYGVHTLELDSHGPGLRVYTFTFG